MPQIRFNHLTFDAPEGRDDTSVVIVDPQSPPGWNLTVRGEALSGAAFAVYVAALKEPDGVVVDAKSERKVGGRAALVVEQHLRADRQTLKQWQAVVDDGARVVLLTMTAREAHAVSAKAAFERALSTLNLGTP
jgi:hypothetical protein